MQNTSAYFKYGFQFEILHSTGGEFAGPIACSAVELSSTAWTQNKTNRQTDGIARTHPLRPTTSGVDNQQKQTKQAVRRFINIDRPSSGRRQTQIYRLSN